MAINSKGSSGAGARKGDKGDTSVSPGNVHPRSAADTTDSAQAAVQGDSGTAAHFLAGVHSTNPTAEVKAGVWSEGFCKSG